MLWHANMTNEVMDSIEPFVDIAENANIICSISPVFEANLEKATVKN